VNLLLSELRRKHGVAPTVATIHRKTKIENLEMSVRILLLLIRPIRNLKRKSILRETHVL